MQYSDIHSCALIRASDRHSTRRYNCTSVQLLHCRDPTLQNKDNQLSRCDKHYKLKTGNGQSNAESRGCSSRTHVWDAQLCAVIFTVVLCVESQRTACTRATSVLITFVKEDHCL
jgi:hypothetical protein